MSLHVFVDESRRGRTYLMAAAVIPPAQLAETRSLMRGLSMPGERRIHFQAEHDSRRRKILAALVASRTQANVYLGAGRPDRVRAACLTALVSDAVAIEAARLVIESRGPVADRTDRATIHRALRRCGLEPTFSYEHLCPHDDPILAVADAVAWAHGAGGDWRRRVSPAIAKVTDLGRCPSTARSPGSRRPAGPARAHFLGLAASAATNGTPPATHISPGSPGPGGLRRW